MWRHNLPVLAVWLKQILQTDGGYRSAVGDELEGADAMPAFGREEAEADDVSSE